MLLYRAAVLVIVQNLSLCVPHPAAVHPRPARTYHFFRGPMPNYSRGLRRDQPTNGTLLCLEVCGDRYYACSVENCSEEDEVCNQYCTSVFRNCFKTCHLESPVPVPIQPHPPNRSIGNGASRDDVISVTTGTWIFNEALYKRIHKSSESKTDTHTIPSNYTSSH